MTFFQKVKIKFAQFMQGRNGADTLATTLLWTWPVLYILGLLLQSALLFLLVDAALIYAMFRMLSRNVTKRREENLWFLQKTAGVRKMVKQKVKMFESRKEYKYFSCPKCRAQLRVPRGKGNITVTCRHCGEKFDKKV